MWRIGERVESGTIEVSRGGLDEYWMGVHIIDEE